MWKREKLIKNIQNIITSLLLTPILEYHQEFYFTFFYIIFILIIIVYILFIYTVISMHKNKICHNFIYKIIAFPFSVLGDLIYLPLLDLYMKIFLLNIFFH